MTSRLCYKGTGSALSTCVRAHSIHLLPLCSHSVTGADTEGRNRGYAHAVFRRLRDAQKVMREHIANPFCIGKQTLRMLYSDKGIAITLFPRPETVRTIWVSNIPFDAMNKELEVLFKPYGLIRRLNMRASLFRLFTIRHLTIARSPGAKRTARWLCACAIRVPGGGWLCAASMSIPPVHSTRTHTMGDACKDRIWSLQCGPDPCTRRRQASD